MGLSEGREGFVTGTVGGHGDEFWWGFDAMFDRRLKDAEEPAPEPARDVGLVAPGCASGNGLVNEGEKGLNGKGDVIQTFGGAPGVGQGPGHSLGGGELRDEGAGVVYGSAGFALKVGEVGFHRYIMPFLRGLIF